jgi:hypothetical protein
LDNWLHGRVKSYAKERGIPVVGAIRLILSEFFRNNLSAMTKIGELPEGVIDRGEGSGLAIDMSKLTDASGKAHVPPSHLSKEQTVEWIREVQNKIKIGEL